jgi:hypothetical protein
MSQWIQDNDILYSRKNIKIECSQKCADTSFLFIWWNIVFKSRCADIKENVTTM